MMSLSSPKKKKTTGPFKSLKKSILRTKGINSQMAVNNDKSSRENAAHRQSIQRITLFEHEYVKVRTWNSESPESISIISNKISFEVYEIYMLRSRQRMNYLCLGKKDQFVHPILPKLHVQRINSENSEELKIVICLFNPDRFWEVTFLSDGTLHRSVIDAFEDTISKICRYTSCIGDAFGTKNVETYSHFRSTEKHSPIEKEEEKGGVKGIASDKVINFDNTSEDVADLEYLLEDASDDEGNNIEDSISSSNYSSLNEPLTVSTQSIDHDFMPAEEVINKTFKHALGRIKPFDSAERSIYSRYKRFSSFNTTTSLDYGLLRIDRLPKNAEKRRSISIPMELNASFDYEKFKRVSWMDVSFEDINEV